MSETAASSPTDCQETGRILTLAGAKLAELTQAKIRPAAYYAAADALGIFQSTLTEARLRATEAGLLRHDFSSIHDQLTIQGHAELATAIPIGQYATALGALLANHIEPKLGI